MSPISVAFICTGNICRSPMAEAIFANKVKEQGLDGKVDKINSMAITSWEVGSNPDKRTIRVLQKRNITIKHKAVQIKKSDYTDYDYLIGMDSGHLIDLKSGKPRESKAVIKLMGDWKHENSKLDYIVEDPWYGNIDDFEYCYKQLDEFIDNFIDQELK